MKKRWIISAGSLGVAFILAFTAGAKKEYAAISFDGVEILTEALEENSTGLQMPVLDIAELENGPITFSVQEEEISYFGGSGQKVDLASQVTPQWETEYYELRTIEGDLPGEEEWDAYILQKVQAGLWQRGFEDRISMLFAHPVYLAGRENLSSPLLQSLYDETQAWLNGFLQGDTSSIPGAFVEYNEKTGTYYVGIEYAEAMELETGKTLFEVSHAILADNPFGCYWFSKRNSLSMRNNMWKLGFEVSPEYITGDGQVVILTDSVERAVANIQKVVSDNAEKSDYDKLWAYYQYIMDATEYNYAAEENLGSVLNAHNLIWAFDGDPETKIVCEGYAKAFKYLCDLSEFTGDVQVYLTSGKMEAPIHVVNGVFPEGPGHMWNIVTIGGENYFVDVTNGDGPGRESIFFLDYVKTGTWDTYYVMHSGIYYKYENIYVYGPEIMTIANHPYQQGSGGETGGEESEPGSGEDPGTEENPEEQEEHVHKKQSTMISVAPTCTNPGRKAYYICACGEAFLDEACTQEFVPEAVIIPAIGHQWMENDCTYISETVHGINCQNCNEKKEEAHTFDEGKITKAPTETETGMKTYTCEKCQWQKEEVLPELDHVHKMTFVEAINATCMAEGRRAYYRCEGCEKIFSDPNGTTEVSQEELLIEKLVHLFASDGWRYYSGTQHRNPCTRGCGTYAYGAHGDADEDGKCDKCGAIFSAKPSENENGGNTSGGSSDAGNSGTGSGTGNNGTGTGQKDTTPVKKPATISTTTGTAGSTITILNGVIEIPTITLPQTVSGTKTGSTQTAPVVNNSSTTKASAAAQESSTGTASVSKAESQGSSDNSAVTTTRKKKKTSTDTTETTKETAEKKNEKNKTDTEEELTASEKEETDTKTESGTIGDKKPTDITEELEQPDSYGAASEAKTETEQGIADTIPAEAFREDMQVVQETAQEDTYGATDSTAVGGVLDQYQSQPLSMGAVMNLVQNEPMLVAIPGGVLLLTLIAGIGFIVVKAKAKKEKE